MRARYYSPYLMRFLNPDPSGFSGGSNWFAYANGNPISLNDPFGLCAMSEQGFWGRTGEFVKDFGVESMRYTWGDLANDTGTALQGTAEVINYPFDLAAQHGMDIQALGPLAGMEMMPVEGLNAVGTWLQAGGRTTAAFESIGTSAPLVDDTVSLFHQGTLRGGQVGSTRGISTSLSSELTHYRPGGQLYEFQVPRSTYNQWLDEGLAMPKTDYHLESGITTPEIRVLPPASGQLNSYLVPQPGN